MSEAVMNQAKLVQKNSQKHQLLPLNIKSRNCITAHRKIDGISTANTEKVSKNQPDG